MRSIDKDYFLKNIFRVFLKKWYICRENLDWMNNWGGDKQSGDIRSNV